MRHFDFFLTGTMPVSSKTDRGRSEPTAILYRTSAIGAPKIGRRFQGITLNCDFVSVKGVGKDGKGMGPPLAKRVLVLKTDRSRPDAPKDRAARDGRGTHRGYAGRR